MSTKFVPNSCIAAYAQRQTKKKDIAALVW